MGGTAFLPVCLQWQGLAATLYMPLCAWRHFCWGLLWLEPCYDYRSEMAATPGPEGQVLHAGKGVLCRAVPPEGQRTFGAGSCRSPNSWVNRARGASSPCPFSSGESSPSPRPSGTLPAAGTSFKQPPLCWVPMGPMEHACPRSNKSLSLSECSALPGVQPYESPEPRAHLQG